MNKKTKERQKDIGLMIIATILFLLTIISSNATDWPIYQGTNDANHSTQNGSFTFYTDYTYDSGEIRDVLVGDLTGDGADDIVVYDSSSNGWNILTLNGTLQGFISHNSDFDASESTSLYDVNSDGKHELLTLARNTSSSKGTFFVIEYEGFNFYTIEDTETLSNDGRFAPVCDSNFCYFVDRSNVVYKYSLASDSLVDTLTIGGSTADIARYGTLDDCSPEWSGTDLAFVLDSGPGGTLEFAVVDLNTFNNYRISDEINGDSIHPSVICEQIGGEYYVAITSYEQEIAGVSCGGGSTWTDHDRLKVYNLDVLGNITSQYEKTHSGEWDFSPGQATEVTNALFYDTNDDGLKEVCYGAEVRDTCTGNPDYKIFCYNATTGATTWSHSSTTAYSSNNKVGGLYVADYNDNGNEDFLFGAYYIDDIKGSATKTLIPSWAKWTSRWGFAGNGANCLTMIHPGSTTTIRYSEDLGCSYTEPTLPTPIWKETFGESAFGMNEGDCSAGSFSSAVMEAGTSISVDNEWYCYYGTGSPTLSYAGSSDETFINTPKGLSATLSGTSTNNDSIASIWSQSAELDLNSDDHISFSCDVSANANIHSFMIFSDRDFSDFPIAISLKNGGCAYNSSISFLDACCELQDIIGYDCSNKQNIDFTVSDATSNCPDVGELNFQNIARIDFWRVSFTSSANTNYFDDIYIWDLNSFNITNNTLPFIIFLSAIPDPQTVNVSMDFSLSIGDAEDPSSAIWSAFDCENDDSLEYNWSKRGIGPSFECTYSATGNYTGKAWISDDAHYPSQNITETETVEIVSEELGPGFGGSCVGFISPVCPDSQCLFYDDFEYTNPVTCNDWEGTDINPLSGVLRLTNLDAFSQLYLDAVEFTEDQYKSFTLSFDFTIHEIISGKIWSVYSDDLFKISLYNSISVNDLRSVDYLPPTLNTLDTVIVDQEYGYRAFVNLEEDSITYYVDDVLKGSHQFFDEDVDSVGRFEFFFSQPYAVDWSIDNFKIVYNELGDNATLPTVDVEYVYNPNFFCGINWTRSPKPEYIDDTCEIRGWPTDDRRVFFCFPRACLQDAGEAIKNSFIDNIFLAIILIILLFLLAPLMIAWWKAQASKK